MAPGHGENDPYNRGFQETFILLQGMASHFQDTTYQGGHVNYTRNGQPVAAPNGQFSLDHDTTQLIDFIDAGKVDDKPFFAHWAVRMAHDPLQAPTELIEKFKGKYDAGYDVLRQQRVDRMKQMGLIPQSAEAARREPSVKPWDQLTPEEQARQSREMEVYAAMITAGDLQIARLVDHLKSIGEYDNTQFIVMSDNGPNAETVEFYGIDDINARFNNSLENIGHGDSFALYGPGWAQASAGPFRLWKGFETEGGTRTGLVVSGSDVTRKGERSTAFVNAMDITPTILDMAGVKHPDTYKGQAILPLQGTSMLPYLEGTQPTVHPADKSFGAEMWGRGALRQGNYKILWVEPPFGSGQWELYDLSTDVAEAKDLSKEQPDRLNAMLADWDKYIKDNKVILVLGKGIGGGA